MESMAVFNEILGVHTKNPSVQCAKPFAKTPFSMHPPDLSQSFTLHTLHFQRKNRNQECKRERNKKFSGVHLPYFPYWSQGGGGATSPIARPTTALPVSNSPIFSAAAMNIAPIVNTTDENNKTNFRPKY